MPNRISKMFMAMAFVACVLSPAATNAKSPVSQTGGPAPRTVAEMARHLVQEQFIHGPLARRPVKFDLAQVHPQDDPNFWAVVGGFTSDFTIPNTYVAAVRLICPDAQTVACWRLDALAINDEIVMKRGFDL
jgi:hypothetical protein